MVLPSTPTRGKKRLHRSQFPLILASCLILISLLLLWLNSRFEIQGGQKSNAVLEISHDGKSSPKDHSNRPVIEPVSCVDLVGRSQENVTDSNKHRIFLRYTVNEPRFWISLHVEHYDPVRWATMKWGKYYEKIQSQAFVDILKNSTSPRLIDVGGNIGWFSLLAAAMGAKVDVFEPNPKNYLRTCESLCANNWLDEPCPTVGDLSSSGSNRNGRLRIFPAGAGRTEEVLHLQTEEVSWNPGAAKVMRSSAINSHNSSRLLVPIVPMDRLAEELGWYDETIDILKIDVEGFEMDVLLGARKFLKSNVVKHIFMEGDVTNGKAFKKVVKEFVGAGYMVFKIGGFSGPQHTDVPPMDENIAENLHFKCSGADGPRLRSKCNLWWKLPNA